MLDAINDAADFMIGDVFRLPVRKALDPLNALDFLQMIQQLAGVVRGITGPAEAVAMRNALSKLDVDWRKLTPAQMKRVENAANLAMRRPNVDWPKLKDVFRAEGVRAFNGTKKSIKEKYGLSVEVAPRMTDQKVIDRAASSQINYVRDQYGVRADAASKRAREIVADGLEKGWGREQIAADLYDGLQAQALGRAESYFHVVAAAHMARARSYASLAGYSEAGIEWFHFQAIVDELTCFPAGTPILMGDGTTRPIELVRAGDVVTSCKGRPRVVTETRRYSKQDWCVVSFSSGHVLRVTPNHPVLVAGRGWVQAGALTPGDRIVRNSAELPYMWRPDPDPQGSGRPAEVLLRRLQSRDQGAGIRIRCRSLAGIWPFPDLAATASAEALEVVGVVWERVAAEHAFDLEVDEDTGYIADGFVVHNTAQCRFMHNRRFSVEAGLQRYHESEALEDPEEIKNFQPWIRSGKDEDGNQILWVPGADGTRNKIADVTRSGMGGVDDLGEYKTHHNDASLQALGIALPPTHGNCRSSIVPDTSITVSAPAPPPRPRQPRQAPARSGLPASRHRRCQPAAPLTWATGTTPTICAITSWRSGVRACPPRTSANGLRTLIFGCARTPRNRSPRHRAHMRSDLPRRWATISILLRARKSSTSFPHCPRNN